MVNAAQFRLDFPEFADAVAYPTPMINFWLGLAKQLINICRWGPSAADVWPSSNIPDRTVYDLGCELFVAHNLVIEKQAQNAAANGAVPGQTIGPVSAKSVDKVSVSYDVAAGLDPADGMWNLSTYGVRFVYFLKLFGMGTLQLGIGEAPPYTYGAYTGPFPFQ